MLKEKEKKHFFFHHSTLLYYDFIHTHEQQEFIIFILINMDVCINLRVTRLISQILKLTII